MQDRFRFRVWKKYNCPSYDGHKPEMFYDAEKTYDFLLNKIPENCFVDILENEEEYIVMQCTGLRDIKGILICEGDICKDKFGKLFTVYFDNKYACFFLKDKNSEIMAIYPDILLEIIGNIYENPELLEKRNNE